MAQQKVAVMVRMDADLRDWLDSEAQKLMRTRSNYIERTLAQIRERAVQSA